MFSGAHALIYSNEAVALRAFLRDVAGFDSVDAGDGWLIFALPPAELGIHPAEGPMRAELYLMCDDIQATMERLKARGAEFTTAITDAGFGLVTMIKVPGGELGLYQPKHPTALTAWRASSSQPTASSDPA